MSETRCHRRGRARQVQDDEHGRSGTCTGGPVGIAGSRHFTRTRRSASILRTLQRLLPSNESRLATAGTKDTSNGADREQQVRYGRTRRWYAITRHGDVRVRAVWTYSEYLFRSSTLAAAIPSCELPRSNGEFQNGHTRSDSTRLIAPTASAPQSCVITNR